MNYKIELSTDSEKYLRKLDKPTKIRILNHLTILTENPRHPELDIKKMQGRPNLYRLRVGTYRILYTIKDDILVVFVVTVGPRGDVYK
ncbi:type II toxin-antitoxin system RelE family toxin [Paenibacillus vini]|uniref:Plasmid stabilization protein n=1 Tax=Paenibacillus vini TaxID=1476024 RepID=A0ABQ4MBE7_9BACL|nr:hypothetical protein J42TS3_22930 [Paenibacillus vini]